MHRFHEIADCLDWLSARQAEQPTLDDIADRLNLSPAHAQRQFKRAVGLSPKQYLKALTLERSRAMLDADQTVLDTALNAGLSGPSRLHDLFVSVEAMTPGEYRRQGSGLVVRWAVQPTPLGDIVVCETDRGIAAVDFVEGSVVDTVERVRRRWPRAQFVEAPAVAPALGDTVLAASGQAKPAILLSGTAFQIQVWRALINVPPGTRVSYGQLATALGRSGGHRAVANAVAANPIAVLIPCHRVIRASGEFGGYRWGAARKAALLAHEALARAS